VSQLRTESVQNRDTSVPRPVRLFAAADLEQVIPVEDHAVPLHVRPAGRAIEDLDVNDLDDPDD
jgi:hypothetical protein